MRLNYEDLFMFSSWFRRLISHHCGSYGIPEGEIHLSMHRVVKGLEVDVFIECLRGNDRRTIIIELKEDDLVKVIQQAIKRRPLASYVYAAINLRADDVLVWLARDDVSGLMAEALSLGVGLVSTKDETVLFRSYDKRHLNWARRRTGILRFIPEAVGDGEGGSS